jgi:hypothetical protein
MFQDGPVAQAVDEVVASGVPYFAAAGNWGRQGYESGFRPGPVLADGAIPSGWGAPSFFGGAAHDFDPGAGVDALQSFTLEPGQGVILSLQWDQPFYSVGGGAGSASDVDVYVLDASGTRVLGGSTTDNVGGDPVEVFGFANDSGATESYNLMIVTRSGPAPGRMKYVNFQPLGAGQGFTEWDTNSGTLFGHANAAGAVAVGAAGWYETPRAGVDPARVQSYSSTGDTPILFDPAGNRLPAPAARPGPRLTGPDGVDTTFFGQPADDGTGYLNFFGTSAAAPAVAAAAALMRQARPAMSPQQVYATLGQTAADMDDPATPGFDAGHDAATGYGLVRADEAVRLAATAPTARVTINDGSAQRSMVTSVTVTFDRAVTLGPAAFSLARPGGTAVGLAAGNPSGDGHTYVLTFDPSQTTGGSLDDGVYELTVGASSALDVTGRGLAADARQTFTRLFGDVNGDAGVNGLDYAAFGRAYGRVAGDPQYVWYLDYDANGGINGLDYYQFGRRYGTTLP